MKSKRPLAILGAGNAATALALLLARHKRPVNLYCVEPDVEAEINTKHRNSKYLKGIPLPKNIRAYSDVSVAVYDAEVVLIAVPSHAIMDAMTLAAPFFAKDATIGSITKGMDEKSLLPMASVVANLLPKHLKKRLCVIGGPAVAHELAEDKPAALMIASPDGTCSRLLANLLESHTVKVACSTDFLGVGYSMALKNIYAIALGMCDGLKYPMNTKAFILSLAIEEMEHVLEAAGAHPDTAASLAGLGDLLVTGLSPHGRNRTYGERLVGSKTSDPQKLGLLTVEGIPATRIGMKLIRRYKVKAPLMTTIAKCLRAPHHFEQPFIHYLKHLRLS